MKKFNLVIAALLVLSVAAFALDVEPSVSVSGDASITFTYDLDASSLEIANATTADLTVTMVSGSASDGEGEVVGYIEATDIELSFDDDDGTTIDAGSVFAAIYLMGPTLHVDITTVGNAIDFADGPEFGAERVVATGLAETAADVNSDTTPTGMFSVVYDTDMVDVKVHVADDDAAAGNEFDFGFVLGLAPVDGLTVDAGVVLDASGALGWGATVGYTVTDLATVTVGVDGDDASNIEVAGTVGLTVAGIALDIAVGTDTTATDLAVDLDLSGLVEMLSLVVNVEFADLADLGISAGLGLDVAPLTPYVDFDYYPSAIGLKIGTGLAVIENVDLDVNYSTADLGNVDGAVEFSATIAY